MSAAQVVWLTAPHTLDIRTEAVAAPGPGAIACATIVSAISPGTELAAYTGQPPLRPGTGFPRVQGYCNVARVTALGEGVTGVAVGDRVLSFTSHRSAFTMPAADVLLTLAADWDADRIVTSYLFHLGYNAVLRGGVRAGHRVLVIGLGALGLTSVAMAAAAGAEVTALSDHAVPTAKALALGATRVVSRADALPEADVVIVTTNGWGDWTRALTSAARFGTIAVLGFPGRGQGAPDGNPLASEHFYVKQLRIEAVGLSPEADDARGFLRFNERDNLVWIARRIADGRLDAGQIVSGRYPGPEIGRAYDDLLARTGDPVTYLLDWPK
ncbi:MAG: zinc-binding dehydrogenase [Pseudomonadota bacterium]